MCTAVIIDHCMCQTVLQCLHVDNRRNRLENGAKAIMTSVMQPDMQPDTLYFGTL